ncbi:MAG: TonB-dependent receptor, partial [Myxococcales bacterium]|nr:TonB-dependent receptor [Myxococcales bacterium]
EANAGELINTEITANADLTGNLDVLAGLDIGIGIELRQDNYTIERGDPVSYAYGRNNIVDPANPIRNTSSFPLVADAVGGIQGFPGFGPTAEVDDGRTAWDFYVDAGQHLTDWWLLGEGARVQNTAFTGMAIVGKVSTRVQATDALSFRASAGNGSRSPGVQQIYYSQRMTAILPAGLTETVTVGDANPLRVAFGMGQLDPETSLSASAGASFQTDDLGDTLRSLLLSADVYQVLIDDRIVLSESVTGEIPAGEVDTPGRQAFRDLLVDNQLGAAQFFVNGIDTKTVGLDVGSGFGLGFGDVGLDLFGEVHYSETSIEASDPQSDLVEGVDLFGPIQRNRVEKGQPRWTATLGQTTHYDILSFNLAFDYVGSVTGKYYMALEDEKVWSGKWLTSASISIEPVEQLIVTVGGSNIFDVFPDEWGMVGREYPEIGYTYGLETLPFGVNGGFYYAALEYTL